MREIQNIFLLLKIREHKLEISKKKFFSKALKKRKVMLENNNLSYVQFTVVLRGLLVISRFLKKYNNLTNVLYICRVVIFVCLSDHNPGTP